MSGIRKKFFFQLVYAVSQLAFPLLTYPYITRTLGPTGLGIVGYVEYITGFIIAIVSFGIPYYGVREAARLQSQPRQRQALLHQLFSLHFYVSLAGALIFFIAMKALRVDDLPIELLILGCATILLPPFIAEWYMQGTEAFEFTTVRSIVLRAAGVVATFLFVTTSPDYIIYYALIVGVQLLVALTNMHKAGARHFLPGAFSRQHLAPLFHFFLTASVISVYVFFDVLILGWLVNDAAVGYYAAAIKMVKLSLLLVLSLNVILFPRISYLSEEKNIRGVEELIGKSLRFLCLIILPLTVGFFLLAPQVVQLLAGPQFGPSVILLKILSLLPFTIALSNLVAFQILIPFGAERKLLSAVIVTCLCSLVMHVCFALWWQQTGTALATIATEGLMTTLCVYHAMCVFRFRWPVGAFLQSCVCVVPFAACIFICQQMDWPVAAVVIISLAVGSLLYFLCQLYIFKNALLQSLLRQVVSLKRRQHNG